MTRPEATCELWVDGSRFPDTVDDLQAGRATVLDGLTLTWGRDSILDQPQTGTAAFKIHDPRVEQAGLLEGLHVGSQVDVWAVGTLPSPGSAPVVGDPSFEDTEVGELPGFRFDTAVSDAVKRLNLDVAEFDGGRAVRITAEGVAPTPVVQPKPVPVTAFPKVAHFDFPGTGNWQGVIPTSDYWYGVEARERSDGSEDCYVYRFPRGNDDGAVLTPDEPPMHLDAVPGTKVHPTGWGVSEGGVLWLTWNDASGDDVVTVTYASGARATKAECQPRNIFTSGNAQIGFDASHTKASVRVITRDYDTHTLRDKQDILAGINRPLGTVKIARRSNRVVQGFTLVKVDQVWELRVLLGLASAGSPFQVERWNAESGQYIGATPLPERLGREPEGVASNYVGFKTENRSGIDVYRYDEQVDLDDQVDVAPELLPGPATVVFPPLPFEEPGDNPDAWDSVPQIQPGESWPFTVRARLPLGVDAGQVAAFAYSAPWVTSRRAADLVVVVAEPVPGDDQWHEVSGLVTLSSAAGAPAWLAVGISAVLPSAISWAETPGVWEDQPARWEEFATAYVDDVQMLAPNSSERRSLVFSGRVSEIAAAPVGKQAVELSVSAVDVSAELAKDLVGAPVWPAEPVVMRADRIAALARNEIPVAVDEGVELVRIAARDVDSQPVLGLLQDVAQSAGAALWTATHAITGPYLWVEDPGGRAPLRDLRMVGGLIGVTASRSGMVSGCDISRDQFVLRQAVDDVVTVVEVGWIEAGVDEEGGATTTDRSVVVVDTADMLQRYGSQRLSVSTELDSSSAATSLATKLLERARNTGWRMQGYTLNTAQLRTENPSVPDQSRMRALMDLLDGTTRIGLGLTLTDLPEYLPTAEIAMAYVEGGSYEYLDGHWSLALNISPAEGQGAAAAWDELPDSWRWDQLDPGLTWADLYGTTVSV